MNFFEYAVSFVPEGEDNEKTTFGLTYGEDYADAAKHITEDYGEDDITSLTLVKTFEENTYEFSDIDGLMFTFKEKEE